MKTATLLVFILLLTFAATQVQTQSDDDDSEDSVFQREDTNIGQDDDDTSRATPVDDSSDDDGQVYSSLLQPGGDSDPEDNRPVEEQGSFDDNTSDDDDQESADDDEFYFRPPTQVAREDGEGDSEDERENEDDDEFTYFPLTQETQQGGDGDAQAGESEDEDTDVDDDDDFQFFVGGGEETEEDDDDFQFFDGGGEETEEDDDDFDGGFMMGLFVETDTVEPDEPAAQTTFSSPSTTEQTFVPADPEPVPADPVPVEQNSVATSFPVDFGTVESSLRTHVFQGNVDAAAEALRSSNVFSLGAGLTYSSEMSSFVQQSLDRNSDPDVVAFKALAKSALETGESFKLATAVVLSFQPHCQCSVLSPDQADDIRDAFNEDFMDTAELIDILLSDANHHEVSYFGRRLSQSGKSPVHSTVCAFCWPEKPCSKMHWC